MPENAIERVLITAGEIRERVRELAGEIRSRMGAGEIVAVGVLTGAFVFLADLGRELGGEVRFLLVRAASYGDGTRAGEITVEIPGETEFEGRAVLLVEDIVDTGRSIEALKAALLARHPRSLTTVALLDKPRRREVDAATDFTGFTVPDEFLVGYGLDYAGRYRNLPDICVLARSVYEGGA
jgi:hypoxanthine phosphoribosyltransferase